MSCKVKYIKVAVKITSSSLRQKATGKIYQKLQDQKLLGSAAVVILVFWRNLQLNQLPILDLLKTADR